MSGAYKKALMLVMGAGLLASIIVGCGRSAVATVNGQKITRQDFYNRMEHTQIDVAGGQQEVGLLVLRDMINEQLLLGLAEKQGVAPTEEQVEERYEFAKKQPMFAASLRASGLTQEQARERLRVQQAHFNLVSRGVKVADSEVRAFFDKNRDKLYTQNEYAIVAGIFAEDKKTADEAMSLLKKGVDFGTVAMQKSSDRVSAARGGRLNRAIVRGDPDLPPEVEQAVLSRKKGDITDPIRGDQGYVIFKILERKPKRIQKLEDVKYGIWSQLMIERGMKKNDLNPVMAKFNDEAKIQVNIERYKSTLTPAKAKPIGATKKQ